MAGMSANARVALVNQATCSAYEEIAYMKTMDPKKPGLAGKAGGNDKTIQKYDI